MIATLAGDHLAEEEPQRADTRSLEEALPRRSRYLDLVYFHENSVEDCALILNFPVAKVKTHMLSARKKLAELVEEAKAVNIAGMKPRSGG